MEHSHTHEVRHIIQRSNRVHLTAYYKHLAKRKNADSQDMFNPSWSPAKTGNWMTIEPFERTGRGQDLFPA